MTEALRKALDAMEITTIQWETEGGISPAALRWFDFGPSAEPRRLVTLPSITLTCPWDPSIDADEPIYVRVDQ